MFAHSSRTLPPFHLSIQIPKRRESTLSFAIRRHSEMALRGEIWFGISRHCSRRFRVHRVVAGVVAGVVVVVGVVHTA